MQRTETEASTKQSDHPYEQFLASQKKRELEWKSVRESKRAKVAESSAPAMVTNSSEKPSPQDDVVTVLRQQLAAKTEECHHLVNRLHAMEETNTKILSCQMQMQENFVKVMYQPATRCGFLLKMLFATFSRNKDIRNVILQLTIILKLKESSRFKLGKLFFDGGGKHGLQTTN